jgi:hypothetical protein
MSMLSRCPIIEQNEHAWFWSMTVIEAYPAGVMKTTVSMRTAEPRAGPEHFNGSSWELTANATQ